MRSKRSRSLGCSVLHQRRWGLRGGVAMWTKGCGSRRLTVSVFLLGPFPAAPTLPSGPICVSTLPRAVFIRPRCCFSRAIVSCRIGVLIVPVPAFPVVEFLHLWWLPLPVLFFSRLGIRLGHFLIGLILRLKHVDTC